MRSIGHGGKANAARTAEGGEAAAIELKGELQVGRNGDVIAARPVERQRQTTNHASLADSRVDGSLRRSSIGQGGKVEVAADTFNSQVILGANPEMVGRQGLQSGNDNRVIRQQRAIDPGQRTIRGVRAILHLGSRSLVGLPVDRRLHGRRSGLHLGDDRRRGIHEQIYHIGQRQFVAAQVLRLRDPDLAGAIHAADECYQRRDERVIGNRRGCPGSTRRHCGINSSTYIGHRHQRIDVGVHAAVKAQGNHEVIGRWHHDGIVHRDIGDQRKNAHAVIVGDIENVSRVQCREDLVEAGIGSEE